MTGYIAPLYIPVPGGRRDFNLNLRKGRKNQLEVNVTTRTGAAYDLGPESLSGMLLAKVRPTSSVYVVQMQVGSGIQQTAASGYVLVTFDVAMTASWTWERAEYELLLTNSSGSVRYELLSGVINALPSL